MTQQNTLLESSENPILRLSVLLDLAIFIAEIT